MKTREIISYLNIGGHSMTAEHIAYLELFYIHFCGTDGSVPSCAEKQCEELLKTPIGTACGNPHHPYNLQCRKIAL